jgi:hypothetical protein
MSFCEVSRYISIVERYWLLHSVQSGGSVGTGSALPNQNTCLAFPRTYRQSPLPASWGPSSRDDMEPA